MRVFGQSCNRRIKAVIRIFERLQTATYIKFYLLEIRSQITCKKNRLRLSLRTIEYATNTNKKYFYTFRINQIIFSYGGRKKERPNFYGMFSQNLPNSAALTAILKMKLPQCNAIGVRTPPDYDQTTESERRQLSHITNGYEATLTSSVPVQRSIATMSSTCPGPEDIIINENITANPYGSGNMIPFFTPSQSITKATKHLQRAPFQVFN